MKWLSSLRRESSEADIPGVAADSGITPNDAGSLSKPIESPSATPGIETAAPDSTASLATSTPVAGTALQPGAPAQISRSDSMIATPSGDATAPTTTGVSESPPTAPGELATSSAADHPLAGVFERLHADLVQTQQALTTEQKNLNELFSTRLRSDEAQGRAVEKLHDELRQYKSNFIRQQLLPLLKEVIFCHDFVLAQLDRLAANADPGTAHAPLDATRQMLIDLLFKYDVEPFRTEDERFDPKSQQCTQTVPTPSTDADKTVAARGLPGFRGPDGIVRREQVTVYKFTPGAQ